MAFLGISVWVQVCRSDPPNQAARANSPDNLVYREWSVQGGHLYRLIERQPRHWIKLPLLNNKTEVFLYDWDLRKPMAAAPLVADRARLVDYATGDWGNRWLLDADRYLVWNERTFHAEVRQFTKDRGPAKILAAADGIHPVRCNQWSTLTFTRSRRHFLGETDGHLYLFDATTVKPTRELQLTDALKSFFEAIPDELDEHNSHCFLTDDGVTMVREATIFRPRALIDRRNATIAIQYDLARDSTVKTTLRGWLRADISDVERVDGHLQFYIRATNGQAWSQHLVDENGHSIIEVPAVGQVDSVRLAWDVQAKRMVQVPGYEANPQPLDQDTQIGVIDLSSGKMSTGHLRYGEAAHNPAVFQPGEMNLSPF